MFPVTIETATSHIGQIERCRAASAHALAVEIQGGVLSVIVVGFEMAVVGKAGRQQGTLQLGSTTHLDRLAIETCSLNVAHRRVRRKEFVARGVVDHPDSHPVSIGHANTHRIHWHAMRIVDRAIERINNPPDRGILLVEATLFTQDRMRRIGCHDALPDESLGRIIRVGHRVEIAFKGHSALLAKALPEFHTGCLSQGHSEFKYRCPFRLGLAHAVSFSEFIPPPTLA